MQDSKEELNVLVSVGGAETNSAILTDGTMPTLLTYKDVGYIVATRKRITNMSDLDGGRLREIKVKQ